MTNTAAAHRHSRYVAGCATCELDMLYFRVFMAARWARDEAEGRWRARDAAGLRAMADALALG